MKTTINEQDIVHVDRFTEYQFDDGVLLNLIDRHPLKKKKQKKIKIK